MKGKVIIDNFDKGLLGDEWIIGPEEHQRHDAYWSITKDFGFLTITTQPSDIYLDSNNPRNFFLRTPSFKDYEISTQVFFRPEQDYEQAGLIIWEDADNFISHAYVYARGYYIESALEVNQKYNCQMSPIANVDEIHLKVRKLDGHYTYFISHDGNNWEQQGSGVDASFSNPLVGIFAISPVSGRMIDAKFKYFAIKELNF